MGRTIWYAKRNGTFKSRNGNRRKVHYIVTGQYGPQCRGPTAHTFVLDTETKQWRDMPPLPVPRFVFALIRLHRMKCMFLLLNAVWYWNRSLCIPVLCCVHTHVCEWECHLYHVFLSFCSYLIPPDFIVGYLFIYVYIIDVFVYFCVLMYI